MKKQGQVMSIIVILLAGSWLKGNKLNEPLPVAGKKIY